MKRSKAEVAARQALGEYNVDSLELGWLIDNVLQGLKDEQHCHRAYQKQVEWQEGRIFELSQHVNGFPQGEEEFTQVPTKDLMKLSLMLKRIVG